MNDLFEKIDSLHALDPVKESAGEYEVSRESLYCERMVKKLYKIIQQPGIHLELAARCHHLCRWEVNRKDFPEGRSGYYLWRNEVYKHQATIAERLMDEEKITGEVKEKVLRIIKKEGIKTDHDVQLVEDIACIVFIENYLDEFSEKYDEAKLVNIIRKTLNKMSEQGHRWLLNAVIPDKIVQLLKKHRLV